jgi:hypothetical protein
MKKVLFPLLALVLALGLAIPMATVAAPPVDKGFDEFGYNYNARLFNSWDGYYDRDIEGGWVPGTNDAWLVMKWSKDWIPMADQPIGAWCTNHFTWYSNDYDEGTWYGWDTRVTWNETTGIPVAEYRVEEFAKLMKVSDDSDEWARYQEGGAFDCGWGSYESGVPKYVAFQDVISVYETAWTVTGSWALEFDYLGVKYNHNMLITTQTDGSFSGTGTNSDTWTVLGTVSDDTMSMTISYDHSSYEVTAVGTIAADGTMSGTWTGPGQSGTWLSTSGQAFHSLVATYNLCTTAPKGLGQPIF